MSKPVLPDPEQEPVVTIPRAGAALGLRRSAAYDAARAGTIPTIQVGGRRLVPVAALRELLGLPATPADR